MSNIEEYNQEGDGCEMGWTEMNSPSEYQQTLLDDNRQQTSIRKQSYIEYNHLEWMNVGRIIKPLISEPQ